MKYTTSQLVIKNAGSGSILDVDIKNRIVKGYGSYFDNIDSDGDYFVKGCYQKTISEMGPNGANRLKYIRDHDRTKVITKFKDLYEDDKGLVFTAEISEDKLKIDYIRDMMILMDDGTIDENSVGVGIVKGNPTDEGFAIPEAKLYEISAVSLLAANDQARITELKDLSHDDVATMLKKMERYERALSKGNLTDKTYLELEQSLYQWRMLLSKSHVPKSDSHEPILKALADQIKNIKLN